MADEIRTPPAFLSALGALVRAEHGTVTMNALAAELARQRRGPLSLDAYRRFLPNGESYSDLRDISEPVCRGRCRARMGPGADAQARGRAVQLGGQPGAAAGMEFLAGGAV